MANGVPMLKLSAALGVLLGGIAGCAPAVPPHSAGDDTKTVPARADQVCPGYTSQVHATCGCPERYIKLTSLLKGVNENLRVAVEKCASGSGAVSLAKAQFGSVEFHGCVEKKVALDPTLTRQLASILDSLSNDSVDARQAEVWTQCFERQTLGAGPHPFAGSYGGTLELWSKYARVRARATMVVSTAGRCSLDAAVSEYTENGAWVTPSPDDDHVLANATCVIDESGIVVDAIDDDGSRARFTGAVFLSDGTLSSNLGCADVDNPGMSCGAVLTLTRR